jgi:hypothetical protein
MALNRLRPYPNLLRGPHIPDEEMDAMDFGNYSRQRNSSAGIQRSEPRRVNFITLQFGEASRPQLERQFAMTEGDHGVFEALAQLIVELQDRQELCKQQLYDFVLLPFCGEVEDCCAICKEDEGDMVWHPSNCHMFHNECLQQWMKRNESCPMCRARVSPLAMKERVEEPMEES